MLKQAALGAGVAGVAWSTPMLTSTASAGPGSCVCTPAGVNLLAAPFGNLVTVTAGGPYAANGSTMTFTRSSANTIQNTTCVPAATWLTGRITNCTAGNISTGQVPLIRAGTGVPQSVSLTINFSPAVSQLAFTLTDIDSSTDPLVSYWEEVTVSWTDAAGTSVPTYSPGANLVNSAPNVYRCVNGTFNAGSTDTSCNLGVGFDCGGTVSSVTIQSNDLNPTAGTSSIYGRMVGLGQLSFCTP